jgi:dephospho-CoA kinase
MHKKPVIGILGGIGSGKSTVSKLFARLGAAVIDADRLAHEVLKQPQTIQQIKQKFGPDVLSADGLVDPQKLSRIVFEDKSHLDFLNQVIHPQVIRKTERLLEFHLEESSSRAVVLDIPLLVEVGWDKRCDWLVFVDCSLENRLHRLSRDRNFDENQLKKREIFQISLDKKAKIAHYIVNNNSDESEVAEQVAQIFSSIISSE